MRYFIASQSKPSAAPEGLEGPFKSRRAATNRIVQIISGRLPRPIRLSDGKPQGEEPPIPLILLDLETGLFGEEEFRLALLEHPMLRAIYELGRHEGHRQCQSRHRDGDA